MRVNIRIVFFYILNFICSEVYTQTDSEVHVGKPVSVGMKEPNL